MTRPLLTHTLPLVDAERIRENVGRWLGGVGNHGRGQMILVTGSAGFVGQELCAKLGQGQLACRAFDIKRSAHEDVLSSSAIEDAAGDATGIVHLAAVSRVIAGERNPEHCRRTNIAGLKIVIESALNARHKPWLIFVSSREVYGNADTSPTNEDCPHSALNTYAQTKIEGERLVGAAREAGLVANVCRLSTVYGSTNDYADRVLPAFCSAAATGGKISIQGADVVLDPTHIKDVAQGLLLLIQQTAVRELLPSVHFVSGRGVSLSELAELAIAEGDPATEFMLDEPRAYDVKRFVGDPRRAKNLLGWMPKTTIESGIAAFVSDFRARYKDHPSGKGSTLAEQPSFVV